MCGIIGYVGKDNKSLAVLIDGLEYLQYRGYDSSGVAFISNNKLNIIKSLGKINNLKEKIDFNIKSNVGIGHTRWATHGKPSIENAHPHNCGKITIIHNGIIENYNDLKENTKKNKFLSETDTEVACTLLNDLYNKNNDIIKTICEFEKKVIGAYAIGMIVEDIKDTIFAIKKNSPLIIGISNNENYIASDISAIHKYTNKYIILDDGDFAKLTSNNITIYNKDGQEIKKEIKLFKNDLDQASKNGFDHFMLKEINEEPEVIKNILKKYLIEDKIDFSKYFINSKKYNKICIIACGSAVHAGLIGKNLIEKYVNIPVEVDIASEFRYKKTFLSSNTLVIAISQSGETADTLEALKLAKEKGCDSLGIINVVDSSISRICDNVIYIEAGSEIAVATTKAYLAQVLILSLIALYLSYKNNLTTEIEYKQIIKDLKELPIVVQSIIEKKDYKNIAKKIYKFNDIFFIGRQIDYALCMEGSLKLKEISYIHSEAYAAGELKHGTISLIDKNTPVFAIVTDKNIASKTISNIKEVESRGGYIILITNSLLNEKQKYYSKKIIIPSICDLLQSIVAVIPLQLIAYETAKLKGCDIDKPKNLAKSVTVE